MEPGNTNAHSTPPTFESSEVLCVTAHRAKFLRSGWKVGPLSSRST